VRPTSGDVRDHVDSRTAIIVFVIVLQRLSAAEITKDRPSRDFRRLSIFDFFNSIGTFRTWPVLLTMSVHGVTVLTGASVVTLFRCRYRRTDQANKI
jgi:hypothetical protein